MFKTLVLAAFLSLGGALARADTPVGVVDLSVPDADRPLHGHVWYPAQPGGALTLVGDDAVWVGMPSYRDAALAPGAFPLVVLSHGLGGRESNQVWLATSLAAGGMIVAAIDHPGTTTGDLDPAALNALWTRPEDISRTISALLAGATFGPQIDPHRIAVIGHSLGGYTALALAGARLAPGRVADYCATHSDEGCAYPIVSKVRRMASDARYALSHRDPRVAAVVAIAPAMSQAMTADSLAAVTVPVLLIAGGDDTIIPPAHVRGLAGQLPSKTTSLVEPQTAGHYDFLPPCKPAGPALLRAGRDEPVCDTKIDRAALHRGVAETIVQFLLGVGFGVPASD